MSNESWAVAAFSGTRRTEADLLLAMILVNFYRSEIHLKIKIPREITTLAKICAKNASNSLRALTQHNTLLSLASLL